MTETWIYERTEDNAARFVLGVVGENPLVCVGVNPSTAVPGDPDFTVRKVERFAELNGFDSWVMLNLYPQRSTDPRGMHVVPDRALQDENERRIAGFLADRPLTILAAWGGLIRSRPYLPGMLAGIVSVADASACEWVSIGSLLEGGGHPRHPSRAGYRLPLQPFDVWTYLSGIAPSRAP